MAKAPSSESLTKSSHYFFSPHDLTRVTDPGHRLYDPSVLEPADPELVESVEAHGVRIPLLVVREAGEVLIEDGRGRHAAALVVWDRQAKARVPVEQRISIPCIYDKTPSEAITGMIVANEHRRKRGVEYYAERVKHLTAQGKTDLQIAKIFSKDVSTIRAWRDILSASPEARQALRDGTARVKDVAAEGRAAQTGKTPRPKRPGKPGERKQWPVSRIRAAYAALPETAKLERQILAVILGEAEPPPGSHIHTVALATKP